MNPPRLSLDLGNCSQSMIARAMPLSIPCLGCSWALLGCQHTRMTMYMTGHETVGWMDSSSIEVHTRALGRLTKIPVQPVRQKKQISTRDGMEPSTSFVIGCMICFVRKGLSAWGDLIQLPCTSSNHSIQSFSSSHQASSWQWDELQLFAQTPSRQNEVFPNTSKLEMSNWGAPSFLHHSEKRRVSMKSLLPSD